MRGFGAAVSWDRLEGSPYGDVFTGTSVTQPLRAFCIDPVGYALRQNPDPADVPIELYRFPTPQLTPLSNPAFLPRHRLRNGINDDPMTTAQIEELFTFQDDLEFDLPKSSKEQSQQTALKDVTGVAVKRYAAGEFSWFATLVPKYGSSSYTLSIALVRDRTQFGEFAVPLARLPQTFGGTGEIVLQTQVPDLRPGQWLMLMDGTQPGGNMEDGAQYDWYRVIATDGINVSISGPDWNSPDDGELPIAVIVPRTVAVYSKTIPFTQTAP